MKLCVHLHRIRHPSLPEGWVKRREGVGISGERPFFLRAKAGYKEAHYSYTKQKRVINPNNHQRPAASSRRSLSKSDYHRRTKY